MKFFYVVFLFFILIKSDIVAGKHDWPYVSHDREGTHCQDDEKKLSQSTIEKLYLNWFKGNAAILASPSVYNSKVYYGDSNGMVHCVNADDGAEIWNAKVGSKLVTSSPTITDDYLFTTCPVTTAKNIEMSHLVGIKRKSGKPIWKAYAEGGNSIPQFEQPPMIADELLILGSSSKEAYENKNEFNFEGAIYAFDISSGFLKWRYLLADKSSGEGAGTEVRTGAVVDDKLGYAYVLTGHSYEEPPSENCNSLICLNYRTDKREGEKIWSHSLDKQAIWNAQFSQGNYCGVKGMPLLFKSHSQCLVGICDNQYNFHTFNRKTGILVTSISLLPAGEKAFPMGPSGAAFDGKVIYAVANSLSNNTFSTQQLAKPLTQGKELSLLNTLAREVKSTLTAFKSSSGKILWQNSFESAVLGVPSVANHLIFIGFFNGYFRVLDAKTGKTLFEFSSGPVSGTYGLPPYNLNTPFTSTAVISDGKVFLAGGFTYPQDASKTIPGGLFSFGIPPKDTSEISY